MNHCFWLLSCLFLKINLFYEIHACTDSWEDQNKALNALELELQAVFKDLVWVLGTELWSPARVANAFNLWHTSSVMHSTDCWWVYVSFHYLFMVSFFHEIQGGIFFHSFHVTVAFLVIYDLRISCVLCMMCWLYAIHEFIYGVCDK